MWASFLSFDPIISICFLCFHSTSLHILWKISNMIGRHYATSENVRLDLDDQIGFINPHKCWWNFMLFNKAKSNFTMFKSNKRILADNINQQNDPIGKWTRIGWWVSSQMHTHTYRDLEVEWNGTGSTWKIQS